MKIKNIFSLLLLLTTTIFASQPLLADIIYDSEITGLIVQAGSSNVVTVRFSTTDNKCMNDRVKFDKNDKELYSYILSLYMASKRVSFYFSPNGTLLGGVSGHNVGTCELINIWVSGA